MAGGREGGSDGTQAQLRQKGDRGDLAVQQFVGFGQAAINCCNRLRPVV